MRMVLLLLVVVIPRGANDKEAAEPNDTRGCCSTWLRETSARASMADPVSSRQAAWYAGAVEKHELLAMISGAQRELSEAEGELDKVVGEIRVALRAEKTAIAGAVEDAFAKLRRAKSKLTELEAWLSSSAE